MQVPAVAPSGPQVLLPLFLSAAVSVAMMVLSALVAPLDPLGGGGPKADPESEGDEEVYH
jgi:hypothetical protein